MENPNPTPPLTLHSIQFRFLFLFLSLSFCAASDADVMAELKKSLKLPSTVKWSDPKPCKWDHIQCDSNGRITRIQLGHLEISGRLPSSLSNLTSLQVLELMGNEISGPLPSLAGLSSLETLSLDDNKFSSIPPDLFKGMTSLQAVNLDNNPFSAWSIPDSLRDASSLQNFSANSANLNGHLSDLINPTTFPSLTHLRLSFNHLEGGLPMSFSGLSLQSLWLNGQKYANGTHSLGGSIAVLQNMTQLVQIWLNMNSFTGPIPDLSQLTNLVDFNLRDNSLTGPVPNSLTAMKTLKVVNLTNNHLQGPAPKFPDSVKLDMIDGTNSLCSSTPLKPCDSRVDALISFLEPFGYPLELAENWKGNDPCNSWVGITCENGNVTVVNLQSKGLSGSISSSIAKITSIQTLNLAHNNITGTIPNELTSMPNLKKLDVSYNQLFGKVPSFSHTNVVTTGNANIGKDAPPSTSGSTPGPSGSGASRTSKNAKAGKIAGIVVGGVGLALVIGLSAFYLIIKRQKQASDGIQRPSGVVIHPSESGDAVKITIASNAGNVTATTESMGSQASGGAPSDVHVIEGNNLVISIQVLRSVTNNFSESNVLGKGGFGTVYKGELHDGTKIAVKRMDSGALGDKGLAEFTSEIAVLTKVRHRNLVALLGYCLDGNERLLVYEYMPQGALNKHLFHWKECGLKPLEWKQRLTIALDVARGVEYLHSLAHQCFIHRDLKPANILLGDDMRAKVSDFGLVRLAPNGGKASIQTKLAGTFGYLAPEYAVMGRITTKVDVFSFGVILMELITGRKALDETEPDERMHLVTWFRRTCLNKEALEKSVDPSIELNEETRGSISTIAELAGHCSAREPNQRPDMSHAVNVLSSLVELWKPSIENPEDCYAIDLDMSLPQALKKWQALEGEGTSSIDNSATSSSYFGSRDNTQTSIPAKPSGFADSFASADAR